MEKNLSFEKKNNVYSGEIDKKLSQSKTNLRIDWMVSQAKGSKVLDIGCSQGILSLLLAKKGFKVIGADINQISLGSSKYPAKNSLYAFITLFENFLILLNILCSFEICKF